MNTYEICGKEYPIIEYIDIKTGKRTEAGKGVPVVDIPMMSDYKWQYEALQDRLNNPQKYIDEDVNATIAQLKQWLIDNKERRDE